MPRQKHLTNFLKKTVFSFVALLTIFWSAGGPIMFLSIKKVQAAAPAPFVEMVNYVNPTTIIIDFSEDMNAASIGTDDFTLTTAASDTETISSATLQADPNDDKVTIVASGAKISASPSDTIRAATGAGAPAEAQVEGLTQTTNDPRSPMLAIGQIMVSEKKLSGATETDEFAELYNPTNGTVDIAGWKLSFIDSTGTGTDLVTFAGGTTMAAGKFRLIGPTGTANADNTYDPAGLGLSNGISVNGTIVLYRPVGGGVFQVVDMVGCGTAIIKEGDAYSTCPSANSSLERKAHSGAIALGMAPGGNEETKGNGYDSNNNNFDFVTQTTPVPQYSGSAAETPGQIGNQPPTIDHMPIMQAKAGADLNIFSMMGDSETPPSQLTAVLAYSTDGGTTWTNVNGVYITNNFFKFTILAANIPAAGNTLKYYLKVTDNATTPASTCAYSMGNICGASDATAIAGAWNVTSVDGSGWTNSIKGQTKGAGTAMNNVTVIAKGNGLSFIALSATDGATTGAFTFSSLPAGMFRLFALAPGYMDGWFEGVPSKSTGAAYTDLVFDLSSGSSGGGGSTEAPRVIFSAPMNNMQGAPTKINIPEGTGQIEAPILIGFSRDLDTATINTTNIQLKKMNFDGTFTVVSGVSIAWQSQNGQATLTDRGNRQVEFGPDRKVILYSATALEANIQYVVDIGSGVRDTTNNPVQGNKPGGGGHIIFFTTGAGDISGQMTTQNFASGGQFMPPYVSGTNPPPGAFNVPTNAKITVTFSETMDSASVGTNVRLYRVSPAPGEYISVTSVLDTTNTKLVTITPSASLTANGHYAIRVLGGARSAAGVTMAPPGQETNTMFQADFDVGSSADTGAPTVLGTSLQMYTTGTCTGTINVCVTGVPVNVGVIDIGFSKDMDTSTTTSLNITLKSGTSDINTSIIYDPSARAIKVAPSTVLYTNTNYILTVTTNVKAMNGTGLASNYVISFTTSSVTDTTAPSIKFANADDYRLGITFSEPMNSATAVDTNNWSSSVLNPANYILYTDNGPPPAGQTALYFGNTNLSTATTSVAGGPLTIRYDAAFNTVIIEGLKLLDSSLAIRGGFRVWVKDVKDLSGNIIQDNTTPPTVGANHAGGPVNSSQNTFGQIGPGGGGMMGPPSTSSVQAGAMAVTDFGGKDPMMMGMKPIGVWPMNMLAGTESLYMIDLPLSQAIPAGGQIVLTFPSGFDVTNAQNADLNKLYAHKDINGPGQGTVVLATTAESPQSGGLNNDGVTVDAVGRTVTITLGAVPTQANDFLHLEIDRIKNSSIAKDFNTSGYTVDIKTLSGTRTLESLTSMPFFIKERGKYTVAGRITSGGTGLNGVKLFGGSPETGPIQTTTANNAYGGGQDGEYKIEGLPQGSVHLMLEPTVVVGVNEYISPMPEPIFINDTTTSNTVGGATPCISSTACYYTKNFALTAASAGAALTVKVIGTFTNEKIDIFAGGPTGFRVKEVTLNGTGTAGSPLSNTINLPADGTYMAGIGPAMPKGPMPMGPPPMPNWMPPKPLEVTVSGGVVTVDPTGPATGDAANDGTISFNVTGADKTISGHVLDGAGNAVVNAEVFAYSPMGGFGTHATTGNDGSFSLRVTTGTYKVGAFSPGMPPSQEVGVEVKDSLVYVNGVVTTDVVLKLAKPDYTISGKVTDGTNVIKDASVFAYRTDGPGHSQALTDSTGKYILYVSTGTWKVGVFLPGYGHLTEQTVAIPPSKSSLNFSPASAVTYYTIKGRVWEDTNGDGNYDSGEEKVNVHVSFEGTDYRNSAITDSSGLYQTKVPAGVYNIFAWSTELGKLPPRENVLVSADINPAGLNQTPQAADIMAPVSKTVTVQFRNAGDTADVTVEKALVQLDKLGSKDITNEIYSENVSQVTIQVSSGANYNYLLDLELPGIAEADLTVQSGSGGTTVSTSAVGGENFSQVTVDGNETVKVLLPDLYTVSGQVKDSSNNPIPDAIVHIEKPGTDIELDVQADSSGNYTVKLPVSGAQPYLIQADKAGYLDAVPSSISVVDANLPGQDLGAEKSNYTISGQVKIGTTGAAKAYVYAERLGGGFVSAQADTSGNYTLNVPNGDWKVYAVGEGYTQKTQTTLASVAGANVSGVNLTLDTTIALQKPQAESITPVSGGTFENADSQFEMNFAPSSLGTSQSAFQVQDKEISNIPLLSPTAEVIGGRAEELSAFDPNGTPVTTLNNEVVLNKTFTKTELAIAGMDTIPEIEKLKMTSYDETAQNWVNIPTTITYLDSSGQAVIPADANLSNVSKVLFNGQTAHFSALAVTNSAPDGLAPSAPAGLSVISPQIGQLTATWSAPTTNVDGSSNPTDIRGYNVYRSTSSNGPWTQVSASLVSATTYTDSANLQSGVTYYYKVTADTGLESPLSLASYGSTGADVGGGGGGVGLELQTPQIEEPEAPAEEEEEEVPAKPITEMTVEELKTEIARIQALIAEVQVKLAALLGEVVIEGVPADFTFEQNLRFGTVSDDVKYLQIVLNSATDTRLAETGVGSPGNETTYFGSLTKAAVVKFQEEYASDVLAPWGFFVGTGFVGSTTIAKLNELLGR